ncbi:prolipoprotein diacylglyceryl transferase family protein [Prosthecobacter sp.]|uniref:prolipoprotein diacylglyceryl transferase n=1 Tax=Prosthecobacter sp. TaxID=1965333 RepID=UPI0024882E2C|nr:prolipoprotein diacylglyceryl transferase family protein [Prosthecobacter sp.]MDI1314212.1 prolipoprotein diacylglyceryl transferase [Prosthecobacter sp.]
MNAAPQHQFIPGSPVYAACMAAGILIGAVFWYRRAKGQSDLLLIYLGALIGGFAGAKIAYLLAEGWLEWSQPDRLLRWATGKSVLGGLLGAYAGVEWVKHLVGHRHSTGDAFAVIVPVGILLGRVGCFVNGCCLGRPTSWVFAVRDIHGMARWPAPLVEGAFQVVMLAVILLLQRRGLLRDRLFFLYLTAYGVFRFGHEFMRDTPRIWLGLSGYQFISLVLVMVGGVMMWRRTKSMLARPLAEGSLAA